MATSRAASLKRAQAQKQHRGESRLSARDSIAEVFRAARQSAGHTQAQAAELIGAGSYRTVQNWESGAREMPSYALAYYLLLTGQHPQWRLLKRQPQS